MRIGKSFTAVRLPFPLFFLAVFMLLAALTALATRPPHAAPQTPCPSQADCDRLKAISDIAAAESAAAKAVADQAESDRAKDLATADRLERDASHPDPGMYPRASDRVGYGQAMRAQAQGLRDKLTNAKANAAARAKTAADTAKAYQDCLDRMKACAPKTTTPPPDTPANSTGDAASTSAAPRRPTSWMVECKDGTTTSAIVPEPSIADVLKLDYKPQWGGFLTGHGKTVFRGGYRLLYDPPNYNIFTGSGSSTPPSPVPNNSDTGAFILQPFPDPTLFGQPTYIPPSCTLNSQGGLTIGRYSGGFEPRLGFRFTGDTGSDPTPGSGIVNPLPLNGYYPIPGIPGLLPPLNINPIDTNPSAPDNQTHRIVIPRLYIRQPAEYYIRPQGYYDNRSQYFWIYDGPGSPHYCAFDFPDALRSFPEIRHALAIEAASRRSRESYAAREKSPGQFQLASFRQPLLRQPSPFSEIDSRLSPAPQNGAPGGPTANPGFTYSIVSNGKSTGEAFQLQLLDTTGKVKSVRMRSGTVVEAIAPGVTQPVTASAGAGDKVVTQPLNGFCLEFTKHPPAEGTLYRLADDTTQQKFEPMRFISRAGDQMQEKKLFHPDSDPKAYTDAILQYALWSKLEGWSQEQFTQHFVERTKENADALHVKWSKEMEGALRAAAPGRWKDISEMIQEAGELQKNSGQGRGGRRGGRGGRGGRRGAESSDQ
jgi:hypothetical protein